MAPAGRCWRPTVGRPAHNVSALNESALSLAQATMRARAPFQNGAHHPGEAARSSIDSSDHGAGVFSIDCGLTRAARRPTFPPCEVPLEASLRATRDRRPWRAGAVYLPAVRGAKQAQVSLLRECSSAPRLCIVATVDARAHGDHAEPAARRRSPRAHR